MKIVEEILKYLNKNDIVYAEDENGDFIVFILTKSHKNKLNIISVFKGDDILFSTFDTYLDDMIKEEHLNIKKIIDERIVFKKE